ncbi:MAG: DUF4838 domain-containing protein [Bacilli bacterium]|nr:DUF4838 domain-containing protein [Bacilli bacterium]
MKHVNKLSLMLLPLILAGCGGNGGKDIGPTQDGEKGEPITKATVHDGVYNIEDSENVFYDGEFHYRLVTKDEETDSMINKSVGYIATNLNRVFGKSMPIAYDESIDTNGYNVVVNRPDLMEKCGVAISEKLNVKVGYQIIMVGNTVFIHGTNSEGIRLGILKFLSATIGYDCLGENCYVFEKNGKLVNANTLIKMPRFNLVEVPDYQVRFFSNVSNDDEDLEMGFSNLNRNQTAFLSGGYHCQIIGAYPLSEYGMTHPEFYDSTKQQVCYTAHGNKESYRLMIDIAADALSKKMYEPGNLEKDFIPFCHCDVTADGHNWCSCSACLETINKYSPVNGANASTLIPYMNDLAEVFDQKMAAIAQSRGEEKRDVKIFFLIYHANQSLTAPESVLPDLKIDSRLITGIAPIQFKYDRDLHDPINQYCYKQVENWHAFANGQIGTWSYNTNFGNYLCPYNTFDTAIDYYRFFFNNGSDFMLNEGNWTDSRVTGFAAFKDYIDSKCLIDLSVEMPELEEKFFKYYYVDAGTYMHKMYRDIISTCVYARENGLTDGGIKSDNYSYYSFSTLVRYADLMDKAYESIEYLKNVDVKKYETLRLAVATEGVFPHYALTLQKDNYLSKSMRTKYRSLLYTESKLSTIDEVFENGPKLSESFAEWGL